MTTYVKHNRVKIDLNANQEQAKELKKLLNINNSEIIFSLEKVYNLRKNEYLENVYCLYAEFSRKYPYYSRPATRTCSVSQRTDRKGRIDLTVFEKKIQDLLKEQNNDLDKYKGYLEEQNLIQENSRIVRENVTMISPDYFTTSISSGKQRLSLILHLSNADQVIRIMKFVNADPEMGAERMLRKMKTSK